VENNSGTNISSSLLSFPLGREMQSFLRIQAHQIKHEDNNMQITFFSAVQNYFFPKNPIRPLNLSTQKTLISIIALGCFAFAFYYNKKRQRTLSDKNNVVTRVVFDIGSRKTRSTIAIVDLKAKKIIKELFSKSIVVPLLEGLDHQKMLSKEMQEILVASILDLQKQGAIHSPTQFYSVGTSVFRSL
jgi:uncharacterized Zn-finger protein